MDVLAQAKKDSSFVLFPQGTDLFAPHANSSPITSSEILTLSDSGVELDTTSGSSVYGTFGQSRADCTFQAWVKLVEDYDKGTIAIWGASAYKHAGIGLRYTDGNNFAIMAMLSVAGGEFQVVDKIAAVETIHHRQAGLSLSYDVFYRIRIELFGNSAVCALYNAAGTLLDSYIATIQAGANAAGYATTHNYAARSVFQGVLMLNSSGVVLCGGKAFLASVGETIHLGGQLVTGTGVVDSFCDGTNGSANTWQISLMGMARLKDFVLTGTVIRKSGRLCGLIFRADGQKSVGYWVYWDNDSGGGTVSFKKGNLPSLTTITIVASQGTLTVDQEYPFTLTVSKNKVQWVIKGNTYNFTADSTYNGAGFIGLVGLSAHHQWKNLKIVRN